MAKKEFTINLDEWKEAEDWGWGIGLAQRYETKDQEYPTLVKSFVQKKCPAICNVFYEAINDGLIAAGVDPGHAIEFCEEMIATVMDEILIDLGMEYCPELIEERK